MAVRHEFLEQLDEQLHDDFDTAKGFIGGRAVVLRVSRSEERLRGQLWEVLTVLVLGLPLVVVLAGVGGYVLARRALTPIDHLAAEARRITAERLHERLSVPNQHDEIGRLAAVINETLRTPLSVIRGIGEVGLGETRTPAEYKEAMGSMLEEVDRLSNLVDTLLRLSRGDAGTVRLSRESVDLRQLTQDVVDSMITLPLTEPTDTRKSQAHPHQLAGGHL